MEAQIPGQVIASLRTENTKQALETRIMRQRLATLVVNTHSRRGRDLYSDARRLLNKNGFVLDATYPVRDASRLPSIVEETVARGASLVIVGGGDGTISAVVDQLVYRDVALGILPLGTANSFARTLGIPLDVEAAVEVIAHGKLADVDLGKIDHDYFANTAAFGLAAAVGRSRLLGLKKWLGRFSYPIAGGIKFLSHRPFRCKFTAADRTITVENAFDVLIANGRYQGGVLVAREASVESRDLVIKVTKGPRKRHLVRAWWATLTGGDCDRDIVETLRFRDVYIDTDPPQYLSTDGEVVTRTPVRATVAPDALKVLVPADSHEIH